MRGVINVFWLDNDHFAVAFSTNHRWSGTQKPEPLHVRLIVFDLQGKQLHSREWDFGAEGPDGAMTLELTPGPDNSILAIHESNSAGKIPDGDFVQVLNADTSLRQDFYVPATSAWVPSVTPDAGLVLETYYANKHSSLTWWSGNPLKPGPKLDLPPGKEETLAGPSGPRRASRLCELDSLLRRSRLSLTTSPRGTTPFHRRSWCRCRASFSAPRRWWSSCETLTKKQSQLIGHSPQRIAHSAARNASRDAGRRRHQRLQRRPALLSDWRWRSWHLRHSSISGATSEGRRW